MLDAAYAILVETGLSSFSIDAVATRSGVARTTIYRWWPSKGLLAMESFREAFGAQLAFKRSRSPDDDLRELVSSLTRALAGPAGRLATSVLAEAQRDAPLKKQFLEEFSEPLRRRSTDVLRAGIEADGFRPDLDIPTFLDAMVGAVYLRLMLGLTLDQDWATALSATLLNACRRR